MFNLKKIITLLMALVMASSFAACGSSPEDKATSTEEISTNNDDTKKDDETVKEDTETGELENKVITMWNGGLSNEDPFILAFEEETGYDVDFGLSWPTYEQLFTAIASGTAPDASFVHFGKVAELALSNMIQPLDDYAAKFGDDFTSFKDWTLENMTVNDQHYGFPWDVATDGLLYYSPEKFREAGLDPNSYPTTWDEFYEYADKLTKYDSNGEIEQIGFRGDIWTHLIAQDGENGFVSKDNKTMQANRESVIEGLEFQMQLYDLLGGKAGQDSLADFDVWKNQNTAMQNEHSLWGFNNYLVNFSDVEWESFPLPTKEASNQNKFVTGGTWALVLPKNSPNPEGGYVLAQWLAENGIKSSNITNYEKDPSKFAPWVLAHKESEKYILENLVPDIPEISQKRVADRANYITDFSIPMISNPVGERIQEKYNPILDEMFAGNIAVSEAVKMIDEQCQPILDKYWEDIDIMFNK